ncbi:DinB family protein [Gordonia sp. CPCC 205333]|uniref:DinB family protein n=1 Tax=Gordonia sp. CPCC 205333 TaxID=3140790 RepID=UPI003AF34C3C
MRTPEFSAEDRPRLPMLATDRESLDGWLAFYRKTFAVKVGGLTADDLVTRSSAPSTLSLAGLARHLAQVEASWSIRVALGDRSTPLPYADPTDPDADINGATAETALADVMRWSVEADAAVVRLAAITDLDSALPGKRHGQPVNLRWVLTHLIEEYARHLGHADIIRQRIDGAVGY